MSSNNRTHPERTVSSKPIPIMSTAFPRGRPRSLSVSSAESSGSGSSPTEIPTPVSSSTASPRINASPGTSPILSYFLAQSPTKSPGTFPFRKLPVFEEEEDTKDLPAVSHARRASTAVAGRFAQNPNSGIPDAHAERGQGLLRRLSLSTPFATSGFMNPSDGKRSPPNAPPNSAVSPTQNTLPFGRDGRSTRSPRRAATISAADGRPRRAPSPMGERILKGHFDGFN